jgi:hypothetical protein
MPHTTPGAVGGTRRRPSDEASGTGPAHPAGRRCHAPGPDPRSIPGRPGLQACGLHLEGGGEAVVTLSDLTPEGPDLTWTVPGLTEAELDSYGLSAPADLQAWLSREDLDGYVVAWPRGGDGWEPQFHLAAPVDGLFEGCFTEPLTRMTIEFYGDPDEFGLFFLRSTWESATWPTSS